MIYVMSGIYGEYDAYRKMLKKIKFSKYDDLYILGNCIDYGPEPIKVLQDMMLRKNVYPIIGEHEYIAFRVLKELERERAEKNDKTEISKPIMKRLLAWQDMGGDVTLEQYQKLSPDERSFILEYLEEFELYDEVEVNGKTYVLVHAGLENFEAKKELDEYSIEDLIFKTTNYNKVYYRDKYLVTGHTSTTLVPGNEGKIFIKNHHIAIDCGKFCGGRLACICLDSRKVYYVA